MGGTRASPLESFLRNKVDLSLSSIIIALYFTSLISITATVSPATATRNLENLCEFHLVLVSGELSPIKHPEDYGIVNCRKNGF